MGLSNFPSAPEGVLPVLVMNTVLSVALLKNMVRSLLHVVRASSENSNSSSSSSGFDDYDEDSDSNSNIARKRRVSITQFKSLCQNRSSMSEDASSSSSSSSSPPSSSAVPAAGIGCSCSGSKWSNSVECCVCLCGFEADEEVSELSCKHFFHKGCLDKWFHNKHITCPICRSIH